MQNKVRESNNRKSVRVREGPWIIFQCRRVFPKSRSVKWRKNTAIKKVRSNLNVENLSVENLLLLQVLHNITD